MTGSPDVGGMENKSHTDIIREIKGLNSRIVHFQKEDESAREKLQIKISRIENLLYGKDGDGTGMVGDVLAIKLTLKVGVWLVAIIGSGVILSLVSILQELATAGPVQ